MIGAAIPYMLEFSLLLSPDLLWIALIAIGSTLLAKRTENDRRRRPRIEGQVHGGGDDSMSFLLINSLALFTANVTSGQDHQGSRHDTRLTLVPFAQPGSIAMPGQ
jgi:hypothetical protein